MIILDTDVCIGILHGHYNIKSFQNQFGSFEKFGITTLTIYELYMGIFKLQYGKNKFNAQKIELERKNIEKLIESLQVFDITKDAAIKSAEIFRRLESEGNFLEQFDCLLGAMVLSLEDASLLSNNIKHFKKIENLRLIELKRN